MRWVNLILAIVPLIIKYGPSIVKMALDIYEVIEDYSKRKLTDRTFHAYDGKWATSKDKGQRFDLLLKTKSKAMYNKELSDSELRYIRKKICGIKNRRKSGKTK